MKNQLGLTPDQIETLYKLKRKRDRRRGIPTPPLSEFFYPKPPKRTAKGSFYFTFCILILMGAVLYLQLGV